MWQNLYHICGKRNNHGLLSAIGQRHRGDIDAVDLTGRSPLRWAYEANAEASVRVLAAHPAALGYGRASVFRTLQGRRHRQKLLLDLAGQPRSPGSTALTQIHLHFRCLPFEARKRLVGLKFPYADTFDTERIYEVEKRLALTFSKL